MGNDVSTGATTNLTTASATSSLKSTASEQSARQHPLYVKKQRVVTSTHNGVRLRTAVSLTSATIAIGTSPRKFPPCGRGTGEISAQKKFSEAALLCPPSSSNGGALLAVGGAGRLRSRSLCSQQMQADAAAITEQSNGNGTATGATDDSTPATPTPRRKTSSGGAGTLLPSLARLRILQSFKSARPSLGEAIVKRATALRPDLRCFVASLGEVAHSQLASSVWLLLSDAVRALDTHDQNLLGAGRALGERLAELSGMGWRPEYFAPLADAVIAECVRLDGGLHKRCETLLAWSQLVGALFTVVRDSYYTRVRYQRRASLPQNRLFSLHSSDSSKSFDHDNGNDGHADGTNN